MVDAYRDPFEIQPQPASVIGIEVDDSAIYYAGRRIPVDYDAPPEVVKEQFKQWRKPQGPAAPLELPE